MNRTAAVTLLAALALTGCTQTGKGTASPPSPVAANPLPAALATIGATNYDFTLAQRGLTGGGSVDPTAMTAQIELKGVAQGQNVDIQALRAATDLYAKFDAGAAVDAQVGIDPTKWMHVDQTQLTGPNAHPFDTASPDTLDIAGLLAGATGVTQTDATHITGTVDLTKATGINAPAAAELAKAGTAAATTPFVVVLDDQKRVVELKIDADAYDKDLTFDIGFADFGTARPVTAPAAADVVPAPAALYGLLNGS